MRMSVKILDFNTKYDAPIAVSLGFFDCIHKGHQKLVENTVNFAAVHHIQSALLTFVNDPNVAFGKDKQIFSFDDRVKVLDKCGLDIVVGATFDKTFADLSPSEFLDMLTTNFNVKAIFVGADYTFGKGAGGTVQILSAYCNNKGIALDIVPFELANGKKISTSTLKSFVKNGEVDSLNEFLALPYFMRGEVVHARHTGTGMGFPTTNIAFDSSRLQLANGVYATLCEIGGKLFKSMTNVGSKPTFGDESLSVETFIIDFSGDLYGKNIAVYFIKKMRNIRKFDSKDSLKAQLDNDQNTANAILDDFQASHCCNLL